MSIIGEILGIMAGICTAFAFMPQSIETIRTKCVEGLSLVSYLIYTIGVILWILYGFYLGSVQMIASNVVSLIFGSIILFMILRWRCRKNK